MQQKKHASPQKLAILSSICETFSFVWHHKTALLRISFLPMVLFFLGAVIDNSLKNSADQTLESTTTLFSQDISFMSGMLYLLASLFSVVAAFMLVIADLRYILLGEHTAGDWVQMAWNRRHWRLIGYKILYSLILFGLILLMASGAVLIAVIAGLDISPDILTQLKAAFSVTMILSVYGLITFYVLMYCALRFMLFAPAVALDGETPLRTSWHALKGNLWRILFLFVLIALVVAVFYIFLVLFLSPAFIISYISSEFLTMHLISPLLQAIFAALSIAINMSFQGVIYKALIGVVPTARIIAHKKPSSKKSK